MKEYSTPFWSDAVVAVIEIEEDPVGLGAVAQVIGSGTGGSVSAGTPAGGVVSCTVTEKLAVPVLPAASVAEQVTGVLPSAKVLPEVGVQLTVGASGATVSLAENTKVTTAPLGPVASAVMSAGTVTVGGVVSAGGATGATGPTGALVTAVPGETPMAATGVTSNSIDHP